MRYARAERFVNLDGMTSNDERVNDKESASTFQLTPKIRTFAAADPDAHKSGGRDDNTLG